MTFRFPASQRALAEHLLGEVEDRLRSASLRKWTGKDWLVPQLEPDAFEVVIRPLPSLATGEGDETPLLSGAEVSESDE